MLPRLFAVTMIITLGSTACSDERTGDFGGDHDVVITNRSNGCELVDWTEGEAFAMTVSFEGREGFGSVLGTFTGPENVKLAALRGTDEYYGDIVDDELVMNGLQRFINHTNGCYYSVYTDLVLTIDDGLLSGQFISTLDNTSSDPCKAMNDCETIQDLNSQPLP